VLLHERHAVRLSNPIEGISVPDYISGGTQCSSTTIAESGSRVSPVADLL